MLQLVAWVAKASRQKFKEPGLERLYTQVRLKRWIRIDQQSSLLAVVVWGLTTAKFYSLVPSTRMAYSSYLALLFLIPGLWSRMAPTSYMRRRQHILVVVRLLPLLFPSLLEAAEHMPSGAFPRHSWNFLAMLVLATRLPAMWVMSLGFRLDLPIHTAVHGIKLLRVLLDNPPLCRTSYFQHQVSQRWFHATAVQFDSAFRAFSPRNASDTILGSPVFNQHEWASCLTVLSLIELGAGFLLPTLILYMSDRASRAAFLDSLQSRSAASGDTRLLPLDADEMEWFLTFDMFASWVMAAAFAPFLLAFLWHSILLATLYLPWLRLPGAAVGHDQDSVAATNGGMLLGTADVAGMGF
ncbi:hypothetical protein N2152v2_001266 [Parachlorella kessleri]